MDALDTHATAGDSSQKQTFNIETDSHRPIITPKEARKILGSESKNIPDNDLCRVIIRMERLAVLLTDNPEIFNLINGENENEQ